MSKYLSFVLIGTGLITVAIAAYNVYKAFKQTNDPSNS